MEWGLMTPGPAIYKKSGTHLIALAADFPPRRKTNAPNKLKIKLTK